MPVLTLFHDPSSPASAVAVARLTRLRTEGIAVTFEGFDPNGVDLALPPTLDALAELDQVREDAEREGVALHRPRLIPPTALAHVAMGWAEDRCQEGTIGASAADALRRAVYDSVWDGGGDISDPVVLAGLAARASLPGDEVADLLADRVELAARRRRMATHRREGVGGVPLLLASRTLVPGLLDEQQLRALASSI